jgi:hypothetical protein
MSQAIREYASGKDNVVVLGDSNEFEFKDSPKVRLNRVLGKRTSFGIDNIIPGALFSVLPAGFATAAAGIPEHRILPFVV